MTEARTPSTRIPPTSTESSTTLQAFTTPAAVSTLPGSPAGVALRFLGSQTEMFVLTSESKVHHTHDSGQNWELVVGR